MATLGLELRCQSSVAKLGLQHSCNSSAEEARLELPYNFSVEKLGFGHSCGLPAVQLRFELSSDSSATKVGSKLNCDSSVANFGLEISGESSVELGFEISGNPSVAKVGFQHPCDSSAAKLGFELLTLCEKRDVDMALDVLLLMDKQGLVLSTHMYGSLLDACKSRKGLAQAKTVQAHMARYHLESTSFLGQDLVITLASCGALEEAIQALHSLPHRTVFAWTAVISACIRKQKDSEALKMYQSMQEEGVPPNDFTFVSLLKACTNLRDLEEGQRLHAEAFKYRYESGLFLGSCLVDMYSKCGSIVDAQEVFDCLSQRDVVTWNVLISAYVEQGEAEKALLFYTQMQNEGMHPDNGTFVSALRACCILAEKEEAVVVHGQPTKVKSLESGKKVHGDAQSKGFDADVVVGSILVKMYGKCGSIVEAENVFGNLSQQDIVSWTAMLSAYVDQDEGEKALQLYRQMEDEGVSPNSFTFVTALKACLILADKEEVIAMDDRLAKLTSLKIGQALHADARKKGLDSDVFLGSTLVSMYAKYGGTSEAEIVFSGLSPHNVVSWTAMLSAYVEQGQAEKALQLYKQMHDEGVSSNDRTLVMALQACCMLTVKEDAVAVDGQPIRKVSFEIGQALHWDADRKALESDKFVSNNLISMYGKCGNVMEAENVFGRLSQRSVVSWTLLLSVYVEQGQEEKALRLYTQMQEKGVSPNERTLVIALQACCNFAEKEAAFLVEGQSTRLMSLDIARAVHDDARRNGFDSNVFIGSTLVNLYGKCGNIMEAETVFSGLTEIDVMSWTAMLSAYVEQGEPEKALQLFRHMQDAGMSPNKWTFLTAIQACFVLADKEEEDVDKQLNKKVLHEIGQALHVDARRRGFDSDVFVGSTLLHFYGKCGSIGDAESVFCKLLQHDVVSWTAMLAAYNEQSQGEKALQLFREMQVEGMSPNDYTFVIALQACCVVAEKEVAAVDRQSIKSMSLKIGQALHVDALKMGFDLNVFVGNSLVTMYGKCGSIAEAETVFGGLSHLDVASWTAMLSAYVEQGLAEKALQLYRQMQEESATLNTVTLVCILQACNEQGSVEICREVHCIVIASGYDFCLPLANTLIQVYGRDVNMVDAHSVFDQLPELNALSWNALMAGYARVGDIASILQLYEEMQLESFKPNGTTFLSVLSACSHFGLVDKGFEYFESMSRDYGIIPGVEHYVGFIDLLVRAGEFTRVEGMLQRMPLQPSIAMWLCLLGACQKHGKVQLGKYAFGHAVHLEPKNASAYVLMSNIYADAGLQDQANDVMNLSSRILELDQVKSHSSVIGDTPP